MEPIRPPSEELTARMTGIGMEFAVTPVEQPLIEETLFHAAREGIKFGDLRVLSILVNWLGVHYPYVHAERLHRLVSRYKGQRVRAFWASIGVWLRKDNRFVWFAQLYNGEGLELLETGSKFHRARHGEDERFQGAPLCVLANVLRARASDILTREGLARIHHGYENRVAIGANWRRTGGQDTRKQRPSRPRTTTDAGNRIRPLKTSCCRKTNPGREISYLYRPS